MLLQEHSTASLDIGDGLQGTMASVDADDLKENLILGDVPVIRSPAITTESARNFSRVSTSLNSEDSSSSDEDLREPMADSPPNLSDEESAGVFHVPSPRPQSRDSVRSLQRPHHPHSEEKSFVSLVRTSSRLGLSGQRKVSSSLNINAVYEAAKPRPPPRKVYQRKLNPSVEARLHDPAIQPKHVVVTTQGNQRIVTLPYVSRGSKGSWREVSGSSLSVNNAKVNGATDEASDPSKTVGFVNVPAESEGSSTAEGQATLPRDEQKPSQSACDPSPSRHTISSSGYSSPGSTNGASSLSPSSSRASSNSSRSLKPHVAETVSAANNITAQPIFEKETEESVVVERRRSAREESNQENRATPSLEEEEDVFPVKEWVNTNEYRELEQTKNDSAVLSPYGVSSQADNTVRNDQKQTRERFAHQAVAKSSSVIADGRVRNSSASHDEVNPIATESIVSDHDHERDTLGEMPSRNIISMVEERTPRTLKVQSRGASSAAPIKLRFPGGSRSKKEAASRNSRAFAMQASSVLTSSQTKPGRAPVKAVAVETIAECEPPEKNLDSLSSRLLARANVPGLMTDSELSTSLAQLDKIGTTVTPPRNYNTVSGATGRHMTEKSRFFEDEQRNFNNNNGRFCESTTSVFTGSTWSLNPSQDPSVLSRNSSRKSSLRNRLKGAFSFQNIRRAISIDKLNEGDSLSQRSVSHSYLNEFGEDIAQMSSTKHTRKPSVISPSSEGIAKAPSMPSIFNTVRMRKRKSRERRAARARNTIAVDRKHAPVHADVSHHQRPNSVHGVAPTRSGDVSQPGHFRPIGRIIRMDPELGTLLVEMVKPPSGPYGFYLARRKESGDRGSVYISSLSDSYPDKMYAGLMKLGDEITEINGTAVHDLPLNDVYDIILDSNRLLLQVKPSQVHCV